MLWGGLGVAWFQLYVDIILGFGRGHGINKSWTTKSIGKRDSNIDLSDRGRSGEGVNTLADYHISLYLFIVI